MSVDALVTMTGALRDVFLGLTAGALVVLAAVIPPRHPAAERASLVARVSSGLWALSAVAYIFVSYAYIRNDGVEAERFVEEVWSFATTIDLGKAYLQMAVAAIVVSVLAGLVRRPAAAAWTLVPVVWALGWQAQTGHAAGASDHHLATSAMFLHLAGSALWMGVLGTLFLMRGPLGLEAKTAVRRGSRIMIWAAIVLIVSGIANAYIRMEGPADLVTTTYGWLLLLKIALMTLAIVLAAWHRRSALPRLSEQQVRDRFWRVMAVDVAAIVAVIVIAAVLSGTAPPLPIVALEDPSPAYYLTGYELPPAPSFLNWIVLWRLEIITAFACAAAAAVYLRWVVRLRRRGDSWPWYRTACFMVGIATMVWITQGAPMIYGMVTFSGHMVEHMMIVMLAPLPLTFGAPITLALRALPPRTDGSRGPREWVRAIVESRFMGFLSNPVVAAVNFAGSLFIFYYSPLFEFALRNHVGHLGMIVHFTLAGYLFANALVGIDPGPKRPGYPLRVVLLFATMAFHAFFGVSLLSSEVLLAPTWFGLMGRTWGPDAISDQQYGAQIAWGLGELPVLALAIGVIVAWRIADDKESRRKDRQAERDDDAELKAYNAMLAQAAENDQRLG
ncbi:cytochrome c oxidase assembly protein [Demequina sp. NBRC 110057]|uniref:cytochrome c oxidase assembly protein n=1 Tax=Demequina sp. NBRC 110057 TaxID=1570346 RepID=UPI000A018800|nr:cytochrome c oxidase assembly protein [Demequina sp. NBRC 110057]